MQELRAARAVDAAFAPAASLAMALAHAKIGGAQDIAERHLLQGVRGMGMRPHGGGEAVVAVLEPLLRTGAYNHATTLLALLETPGHYPLWQVHFMHGAVQHQLGNYREAAHLFATAWQASGDAIAAANAASSLAMAGRDEEAREYLTAALAHPISGPSIRQDYGWLVHQLRLTMA